MTKFDFNKDIAIAIIFVACIFLLWKFGILYSHSLFPVVKEDRLYIFIDWSGLMKISECYKYGVNVYHKRTKKKRPGRHAKSNSKRKPHKKKNRGQGR